MLTPALSTALTISIPTFAVMLAVIFNRQDSNNLRAEMAQLRKDLNADMAQLRKDLNADTAVQGSTAEMRSCVKI